MSAYLQPDRELTEEEKLLAEVIGQSQRIPCGGQIALSMNLRRAIGESLLGVLSPQQKVIRFVDGDRQL